MSLVASGRDLATIKVNRQRKVALVGELARLFFDPIVQSPPFMDHDDRGKRPFAFGRVEDGFNRVAITLKGDVFGGGGEQRNCH